MVDVSCSSLADFLTSVGLPMYLQTLIKSDVRNLDKVREMGELDWRKCGITDPRHLRRLTAATDILKLKRHAPIRKLSEVRDKVWCRFGKLVNTTNKLRDQDVIITWKRRFHVISTFYHVVCLVGQYYLLLYIILIMFRFRFSKTLTQVWLKDK